MGLVLSPELWGLVASAFGLCGWVFGELHGASRARIAEQSRESEMDELFSLTLPLKPAPKVAQQAASDDPLHMASETVRPIHRPVEMPEGQAPDLEKLRQEHSQFRRQVFAEMPPIGDLRAQAKAILQDHDLWSEPDVSERLSEFLGSADPKSIGLLRHYRDSIAELRRVNEIEYGSVEGFEAAPLPRLMDVAPMSPDHSMVELVCRDEQREELQNLEDTAMPRPRYSSMGLR